MRFTLKTHGAYRWATTATAVAKRSVLEVGEGTVKETIDRVK